MRFINWACTHQLEVDLSSQRERQEDTKQKIFTMFLLKSSEIEILCVVSQEWFGFYRLRNNKIELVEHH